MLTSKDKPMARFLLLSCTCIIGLAAQTRPFSSPLAAIDSTALKAKNVTVAPVTFKGRASLEVRHTGGDEGQSMAILSGTEFEDGVIEVDLAGDVAPGAIETARGFTGVAFRVSPDTNRYECFYLRPSNGRAEDQERRNHSAQYVSMPEFPWHRLRQETPSRYESYVDLVPGEWTKVRIEVAGQKARLFVNGAAQPTLIVNDLKHGISKGQVALWVSIGTVARFSSLRIQPR
jgi:hypothetical protein